MGYLSKQPAMDLSILSTLISENYAARADAPRCRSCQCKMRLSDSGERKLKTFKLAPEVGFEPTTNRLTADRSTTELRWNFWVAREGLNFAQPSQRGK